MKVSKHSIPLLFWIIACCISYAVFQKNSNVMIVVSMITVITTIYYNMKLDKNRITFSTVILLYTIATQFGLVIFYFCFGKSVLSNYREWTLAFLDSSFMAKALFLGNLAVLVFSIAKYPAVSYEFNPIAELEDINNEKEAKKMNIVGSVLLTTVLISFAFFMVTGRSPLFSSYDVFRQSSLYNSAAYSYLLILFYVGTIYLAAAGRVLEHKIGWIIWLIIVIFFALNGNKGEFMYSLLAVIGMKGVEGKKVSIRMVAIGGVILFFVIPSITMLRDIGVANNLRAAHINYVDAFVEMGMQIRTSVYSLEDLSSGNIGYLYGASYYQPVLNFIPFLKNVTATAHLRQLYPGYGFNQVIESFLNFGYFGTISFFAIVGRLISKWENVITNRVDLAYLGTVTCILINATRNYFAFVPGQIVIVTVIYLIVKKV